MCEERFPTEAAACTSVTTVTDEDGLAFLCDCLREAEMRRRGTDSCSGNTLLHPAKAPNDRFSDSVGWLSKPRHSSFLSSAFSPSSLPSGSGSRCVS